MRFFAFGDMRKRLAALPFARAEAAQVEHCLGGSAHDRHRRRRIGNKVVVASSSHCYLFFYTTRGRTHTIAVLLNLISLLTVPICFYLEMKQLERTSWEFDWSYGMAWGATLFGFSSWNRLLLRYPAPLI